MKTFVPAITTVLVFVCLGLTLAAQDYPDNSMKDDDQAAQYKPEIPGLFPFARIGRSPSGSSAYSLWTKDNRINRELLCSVLPEIQTLCWKSKGLFAFPRVRRSGNN